MLEPTDRFVVGVDLGRFESEICLLDRDRGVVAEHLVVSSSSAFDEVLSPFRPAIDHIVIEATASAYQLGRELRRLGYPILLVDPRSAKPFLRTYRPAKTDKNDAFGLAQLVVHGAQKAVWLRSAEASELGAMLATRDALIHAEVGLRNAIGSHLAALGLVVKASTRAKYLRLFREALGRLEGYAFLDQLHASLKQLNTQITLLDKTLKAKAADGEISRLLMTIPGVGPFTALRFIALIDNPTRFKCSRSVGVYTGLTARIHRSGTTRRFGGVTRTGSAELRRSLFMCAQALLTQSKKHNRLRDWALRLAKRRGKKRAITALARKLAVVMHAVWISGQPFRSGVPGPA